MTSPPPPDVLQRLRALRQAALAASGPAANPVAEDHRASLTQVHDDVRTVLHRIDAAEAAMRPVLMAWAQDPARGGAHLLDRGDDRPLEFEDIPPSATAPWPTAPQDDLLPDTVRPATPPPP